MAKVVIELEFGKTERNIQMVRDRDVYEYLYALMEDGLLDYTVYDGDETYGPMRDQS
tara:strand:- start:107 stop:277 length:171 start_codon:yes stop_codon:yes gene_type:complete